MDEREKQGLPPLEWLRVFEAAGRSGSFTAAARALGLTQAAVSQRIRNLEMRLGPRTFCPQATRRRTDSGRRSVPATRAGGAWRAGPQHGRSFFAGVRQLTIAAMPSHIELLVLPRLGPFLDRHGDLRSLSCRSTGSAISTLLRRICICGTAMGIGLDATRNCCSAKCLRQPQHLPLPLPGAIGATGPVVDLSGPRSGWRAWSAASGTPAPSRSVLQFDSFDLVLSAALQGLGVILASLPLSATALAEGRLVRLPEPEVEIDAGYWLCWAEDRQPNAMQQGLVEALGGSMA